jgi:hypothetical protein
MDIAIRRCSSALAASDQADMLIAATRQRKIHHPTTPVEITPSDAIIIVSTPRLTARSLNATRVREQVFEER